jgi:hypothetical protein
MQEYIQKQTEQTKAFFKALEKSRNSDIKAFTWMIDNGCKALSHGRIL